MVFNSTEAQEIATSGKLIGPPLGYSSTTSAISAISATSATSTTTNPSSSLSGTISTSTAPTPAPIDSGANVGAIVGGVVGGVLGLLLIGVLVWWILRQRRPSYEGAGPIYTRTSQVGVFQSPITNTGHLPRLSGLSPVPGQATLESTPYILPPVYQGAGPYPGDNTSHLAVTKPLINPPGYPPPEAAIRSLPQPNPQAHMTLHFNTDLGHMITATPGPMGPETPNPPSYMASQAESRE